MARGGIRRGTALVAAGGTLLWAAAALSEQSTPQVAAPDAKVPPRLVFNLSTGINADSNRNLQIGSSNPATTLDTRLGLSYSARTRLSSLDASLQSLWRLGDAGNSSNSASGTGLQEPTAKLAYSYDDGDTKLTLSGHYRKSPVNLFEPLVLADGTLSPTDLTATTGSVISWGAQLGAVIGESEPVSFLFSASTDRRNYVNNTDPNIFDSRTNAASGTLRFNIDPLNRLDLTLGYRDQNYSNALQTHRKQRQLSATYVHAISPTLSFQGEIGYSRNRTNQLLFGVLPSEQTASGLFGSLGLTQTLADGSASATFASERDSFGVRNSLELGRSLTLPTGKLDALAGVSIRPGYGPQMIGSLSYGLVGPVDSVTAAVSRAITLDANNNDVAYTSLSLGYSHKVNPVASLDLSLSLNRAGDGGLGSTTSVDRQSLRAAYSYQLTPDWDLDTGYLYRHLNKSGSGSATSNSVFVTIGRKFTLWP